MNRIAISVVSIVAVATVIAIGVRCDEESTSREPPVGPAIGTADARIDAPGSIPAELGSERSSAVATPTPTAAAPERIASASIGLPGGVRDRDVQQLRGVLEGFRREPSANHAVALASTAIATILAARGDFELGGTREQPNRDLGPRPGTDRLLGCSGREFSVSDAEFPELKQALELGHSAKPPATAGEVWLSLKSSAPSPDLTRSLEELARRAFESARVPFPEATERTTSTVESPSTSSTAVDHR